MQGDMATKAILTLNEVIEVQNDDSDGEMSDGSEDDFEGCIDEDETRMERQQEDDEWSVRGGQNSGDEELTDEEQ